MAYVCLHCKKEIKALEKNFVRCPYCGYRVLAKKIIACKGSSEQIATCR